MQIRVLVRKWATFLWANKICISSEESTGLLFAKWLSRNFPQASAQISWDLWGFSWYTRYWGPVPVTGTTEVWLCPCKINEIIIVQCFHLLWIWQWWGEWDMKSIISPLIQICRFYLTAVPSPELFQSCPHDCAWGGQGMHSEGLPSSLCHDQLLAQRTAKQCKVFEFWEFSLEQHVLKQWSKNKCLFGKF